jgi:drug/metabolite transporter (DMT)-like permease
MPNVRSAGLVLALLSAAAFSTSGPLAGSLITSGWTPGAAVVARLVIAAGVLTVPAALALRGRWSLLRSNGRTVALYGVLAVAGAQFAYFNAVSHLSVGVALLLEYQGIVLVVGWLWLRHGRRPRPLVLAGSVVAIAGLALVLDVVGGFRLDGIGVVWGLVAAVGLAVYFVLASDDAQPLPPLVLSCAALWVGALTLAGLALVGLIPFGAATGPVTLANQQVSWLVPVLGLSLVAAALAYVLGIFGARLLGATLASFVGLAEVLFAVGFAWLFVGQVPTVLQAVGGGVVIAGVTLVRLGELRADAAGAEGAAGAGAGATSADEPVSAGV